MESIGQLAAGLAHEINNPIGYITSNLQTMTDYTQVLEKLLGLYQTLETEIRNQTTGQTDILEEIHALTQQENLPFILKDIGSLLLESQEGAMRVTQVVHGMKYLTQNSEGILESVDLNACVESALSLVANELKFKCEVNKQYGEIPPIFGYSGELHQVFTNMFINAAQAIEQQGKVCVETRLASNDSHVEVLIKDTGRGIPEELLNQIFNPFFTTKTVWEGTGLGLAICYKIIQKHGGSIRVESHVGEGASFTVAIPVKVSS
jgi:two-component system, NtrC family, sensor kinase